MHKSAALVALLLACSWMECLALGARDRDEAGTHEEIKEQLVEAPEEFIKPLNPLHYFNDENDVDRYRDYMNQGKPYSPPVDVSEADIEGLDGDMEALAKGKHDHDHEHKIYYDEAYEDEEEVLGRYGGKIKGVAKVKGAKSAQTKKKPKVKGYNPKEGKLTHQDSTTKSPKMKPGYGGGDYGGGGDPYPSDSRGYVVDYNHEKDESLAALRDELLDNTNTSDVPPEGTPVVLESTLITPFTLEYIVSSSHSPSRRDYETLSEFTVEYLHEHLDTSFADIDKYGYVLSDMEEYKILSTFLVEFYASAKFDKSQTVPDQDLLSDIVKNYFTGGSLDDYQDKVNNINRANPFSSTTKVVFHGMPFSSEEEMPPEQQAAGEEQQAAGEDNSNSKMKSVVAPTVAAVFGLLVVLGLLGYTRFQRRRERQPGAIAATEHESIDLVKPAPTAAKTDVDPTSRDPHGHDLTSGDQDTYCSGSDEDARGSCSSGDDEEAPLSPIVCSSSRSAVQQKTLGGPDSPFEPISPDDPRLEEISVADDDTLESLQLNI